MPLTSFHHKVQALLATILMSALLSISPVTQAQSLNNAQALSGVDHVKAIYDVRKSHPKPLLGYLKAIETNVTNLKKEGVTFDLQMIFISKAVTFITTEPEETLAMEHDETLEQIAKQIARLQSLGVKMEACGGATAYFNVDNDTLLPGIEPVRSGFISLMGWQAKGYGLVTVY
ncbi:MAG: DsrE family protein [Hydrogenovibrio sp.]|uniref:DsrE family protein n=1 Tax=Hydrogenovibrio TaxID=28884 RepID=UPI0006840CF6|nr:MULTISPECIES: DsrE family protein [Hydrogenovibrio]MDR9498308.1 DsrE family protein [Hydrogenovibrio sp.]